MDKREKIFTITKTFSSNESNWKSFCLGNIWILFITILPLNGIIIGFYFRNDCPLEKNIPFREIINGFMTIGFLLLICITKQIRRNDIQHPNWVIFILDQFKILLICFSFCMVYMWKCDLIFIY